MPRMEVSEGLLLIQARLTSWYPGTNIQGTTWSSFLQVEKGARAAKIADHQGRWLVELRGPIATREKVFRTQEEVVAAVREWLQ